MSDIKLQNGNQLLNNRSIGSNVNNIIPRDVNVFSSSPNTLKKEDSFRPEIKSKISNETPFGTSTKIKSLPNNNFISRDDLNNRPVPPTINVEATKSVVKQKAPANAQNGNKVLIDSNEKLLLGLDAESAAIVRKFPDLAFAPYPKEYKCSAHEAVIDNTSLIKDFECSQLYSKTPLLLAADIYKLEQVKSDPELKAKLSNFISLLGESDKAALAYTKNMFDRNPPLTVDSMKDIFDNLSTMLKTTYDPQVGDTKALVIAALHDVSMPSDISQELIGTCTGTTVQIQMAIRNPVEYLKMLDTLAKKQDYTSVTGAIVKPNFTFTKEGVDGALNTGRTMSAKIMQNSIMDFSDAETRNFDSSKGDGGLTYEQTVKALREIVNINVESSYVWDYNPAQLMNILKDSKPSSANPVEISLSYDPHGRDAIHSVNVISADDNQVTIANPWGREETFPAEELKKRILSVSNPVNLDKKVEKIDVTNQAIRKNLSDNNTKADTLNKITVGQKMDMIENITTTWDGIKYNLKPSVSEQDKAVVINILDELLQSGEAQNNVWEPRLKWFAKDMPAFLDKIQQNSEAYNRVKTKLSP